MANNPYVNKVVKADGTTIIDISDTTAAAADVAAGKYFYTAAGAKTEGTASGGGGIVISDAADPAGGTVRTITAVEISGTKSITANGTGIDVAEYAAVDVAVPAPTPELQTKTNISPTESSQTITADTGYDGLDSVQINAISSSYVGSGVTRRDSDDLTASGATVTAPAGYYASAASKSVASGTAGTPSATKGTVSNHSVTVTPSVTNTAGYISGGTKNGTAVTVSASELVSGSETKTQNGTYDVTNLASLVVNVSGGGGKNVQYVMDSASVHTNGYTSTGMSITVAKAGTYKVSWVGWRSSSQGAMGTNLYKNGNAGTNQTTFTNTYGQCITLNNQSYNQGDVLTLYATAGSTTRYMWVANLIIEEQ